MAKIKIHDNDNVRCFVELDLPKNEVDDLVEASKIGTDELIETLETIYDLDEGNETAIAAALDTVGKMLQPVAEEEE